MIERADQVGRRGLLAGMVGAASLVALPVSGLTASAATGAGALSDYPRTRQIPSTGEVVPVIGMGTWITFNVGYDDALRHERLKVARAFFEHGGGLIDSSPMYGSSEAVVGWCLQRISDTGTLFSATKVWSSLPFQGRWQMDESHRLWGVKRFDLMQIHNLLAWDWHLGNLRERKQDGRIRYIGVTTSHGRRHGELEEIMCTQPIDFVQLTYNVVDRAAEQRLLPLAAERGLGVVINRPFRGGWLPDYVQRHPLPDWATEIACRTWPELLLKFIISHPAVTCAIPATTRVVHMAENMAAARGPLPDAALRRRIVRHVESL